VLQLIKDTVSRDTVEALEQLLDAAKNGEIAGMAFAVALKSKRFVTNTTGACYRDPTLSRGMIAALDDELSGLVHQRSQNTTI
jgi:hypothetical protein